MKQVLAWTAAILLGALIGAASAWWMIESGRSRFMEELGPWTWSRATGAVNADAYTRASIARSGLLALSADEALYFTLDRDENGQPLREECVYEIEGRSFPARWWSVTLYARDNFLAQNNDRAFSVDSTHVEVDGMGRWQARIAPVRGEAANWISSRAARSGYSLTLRVYNPDDGFPSSVEQLPTLRTLSCPDAPA